MKEILKRKKDIIIAFIAIFLLYLLFNITGIGCPIKFLTGISCAGCGMTRAWFRVLHLDFSGAFTYHPLFFVVPIAATWFIFKKRINANLYKVGIIVFAILFLVIYVVRMLDSNDNIVVFEPMNNIYFKIKHWV